MSAVPGASGMGIYTLGDGLLHVVGPHQFTGFCGIHTGWIEARVRVLPGPPAGVDVGWDAISEATLFSPSGRLSVVGLMGGIAEALTDVAVPRGLIRVRVHARDRLHETVRTDDDPPERHELHIWAVSEETPWRTVLADPGDRDWEQKPAKAAEQAMLSLVPRPSGRPALLPPLPPDPYEDDTGLSRVAVVRHRPAPVEVPAGVLPAGDLEVRLRRVDDETLLWSWSTADEPIFPHPLTTQPDNEPSTVRLTSGPDGFTLRHEGVLGRHAFALGLIWDHLLDAAGSYPWVETLRGQAAEATALADRYRRLQAERDAERWGGAPPSDRVRGLAGQAQSLARIDRRLLDRVDALPAARQREAACWAARRAMRVAGLEQIGWIADALAAAEADRPLPSSFTDQSGTAAFHRLLSDPEVPHTTVTLHFGSTAFGTRHVSEALQQAAAFPALIALANDDPLAAAIDAVYNAAIAHGDERDRFLTDAHIALR
ncbi:hypothetical protein JOD64_005667 [Micromonospora luteifusca]|uniref:ApeA N-terminal domain-containing protein n=1 Tax=Micromonospora luteifusca TaxID=709860 RepID=A0ABS2M1X3_9ACTN|nr:hypothetical protein [Micromonospora luteifusca]MBM7494445.1 hypothetical protein [Micromonospora luteifusca]